jgi:hypothetical protein
MTLSWWQDVRWDYLTATSFHSPWVIIFHISPTLDTAWAIDQDGTVRVVFLYDRNA